MQQDSKQALSSAVAAQQLDNANVPHSRTSGMMSSALAVAQPTHSTVSGVRDSAPINTQLATLRQDPATVMLSEGHLQSAEGREADISGNVPPEQCASHRYSMTT